MYRWPWTIVWRLLILYRELLSIIVSIVFISDVTLLTDGRVGCMILLLCMHMKVARILLGLIFMCRV